MYVISYVQHCVAEGDSTSKIQDSNMGSWPLAMEMKIEKNIAGRSDSKGRGGGEKNINKEKEKSWVWDIPF